jgi:hypothetical protein
MNSNQSLFINVVGALHQVLALAYVLPPQLVEHLDWHYLLFYRLYHFAAVKVKGLGRLATFCLKHLQDGVGESVRHVGGHRLTRAAGKAFKKLINAVLGYVGPEDAQALDDTLPYLLPLLMGQAVKVEEALGFNKLCPTHFLELFRPF